MNAVHWREDYSEFAESFISRGFSSPHSTKAIEDGVGWALARPRHADRDGVREFHRDRRMLRTLTRNLPSGPDRTRRSRQRSRRRTTAARWRRLVGAGRLEAVAGAGRMPHARRAGAGRRRRCAGSLSEEARRWRPARRATRAVPPPRRPAPALCICSSPIRLGHARRDIAMARELRQVHPGPARSSRSPRARSRAC